MRLVDAGAECERLLDFIAQNDSGIKYAIERRDMTMLEDIFFDFFNDIPAAYDVDKVVERLEKERNPIYREDGSLMCARIDISIDKAIDIVKSGIP